ncbi:MAG: hypothetical protein J7L19_06200 [Dehalococcoidia bacterium]|nr:hypothetical protein [Dehalococcoidia bacterium]
MTYTPPTVLEYGKAAGPDQDNLMKLTIYWHITCLVPYVVALWLGLWLLNSKQGGDAYTELALRIN